MSGLSTTIEIPRLSREARWRRHWRHRWRPLLWRLWPLRCELGEVAKRWLDITAALLMLLGLLPLFALLALMIRLTSRGPVLYWQKRVGREGRPFDFPKFRSMVANAEALQAQLMSLNSHGDGITFKIIRDPRVTPIGRIMRRLSLDELPQLWCVLTGEMSLVGPRPPLPREVARYRVADRRRLDVTPGLTCLWQIKGRSCIPFPEQVRLDREYIESRNLWLDLDIIRRTIPAILHGRGAC